MIKCEGCDQEITGAPGDEDFKNDLVDMQLYYDKGFMKSPWYCTLCGSILSPYRPLYDRFMVVRETAPTMTESGLHLPISENFIGSALKAMRKRCLVIVAGKGYTSNKGRFVASEVRVGMIVAIPPIQTTFFDVEGMDGMKHDIIQAGPLDIRCVYEEGTND